MEFNSLELIMTDLVQMIIDGKCTTPKGYKLNDDKTELIKKTDDEILEGSHETLEEVSEWKTFLETEIAKMEKYLTDTDWYVSRKAETDKAIPGEVVETRSNYREKISQYREQLKFATEKLKTFYKD